jgi:hypothetical protein
MGSDYAPGVISQETLRRTDRIQNSGGEMSADEEAFFLRHILIALHLNEASIDKA